MPAVPSGIMEMCIENQKNSIADLFSTHPSVQRRVDKLIAVAGGRDPGKLEHSAAAAPAEGGRALGFKARPRPRRSVLARG